MLYLCSTSILHTSYFVLGRKLWKNTSLAERRAALLHAGAQVSRNITSILDPEVLLQKTVDIICEEFGFYYAGVFLLDADGAWAVLQAGRGDAGTAMVAEGHKLRVGGLSMIGAATGRNTALIALDVGEEAVHFKNPHLPLTRSEMALPLAVGDEVIGALTVQSVEEAAFSEDDITALQAMADQLAVAIRNAKLYSENAALLAQTERRSRLLAAASEVGKGVTSILDLDELLHKTVDIICEAYGFYYAGVFLLDAAAEWAVLRAGHGDAGAAMVADGHKLRIGGLSMIGASIAERKARIALDVGEEAVFFKNPHLPETRSEMALPLVAGESNSIRVIGAVTVQSKEEAAFSDEDISSLQAMADQLAVALDNAQLLRELEVAHAELVRTKTFEAIATATTEAIHWIGNKALPITVSVRRLREDLEDLNVADADMLESMREDLMLIEGSAQLIVQVQEHLIGPAREYAPAPAMIDDVVRDTASEMGIAPDVISLHSRAEPAAGHRRYDAVEPRYWLRAQERAGGDGERCSAEDWCVGRCGGGEGQALRRDEHQRQRPRHSRKTNWIRFGSLFSRPREPNTPGWGFLPVYRS